MTRAEARAEMRELARAALAEALEPVRKDLADRDRRLERLDRFVEGLLVKEGRLV